MEKTKLKVGDAVSIPDAVYEYFRHPSKIVEIKGNRAILNVPDDNPVQLKDLMKAEKECDCARCKDFRDMARNDSEGKAIGKMSSEQILSAVSGMSAEETKKVVTENKEFVDKLQEFCKFIGKESENHSLIPNICTSITALIQPLQPEERLMVLKTVGAFSLSGRTDEMLNRIRKFKEDEDV